jgi:hypothetical protein
MRELRNVMSSASNFTWGLVNDLNSTLGESMHAMTRKVNSLQGLLTEDFESKPSNLFVLSVELPSVPNRDRFLWITLMELLVVITGLILMQQTNIRATVIEKATRRKKIHRRGSRK